MVLQDCIKELIKMEENASKLYDREARNSDERLEPVMNMLANEELKHRDALCILLESTESLTSVLDEETVKCLNRQKEFLKKGIGKDFSQKNFFKFALQLETNSVEIYKNLAANFTRQFDFGKIFAEFVPEEKKHMIFILNMLHEMS